MVQKSTRLSYSVGADGFETRRRSSALYGVVGAGARSDVQYRVSRRSTSRGGVHVYPLFFQSHFQQHGPAHGGSKLRHSHQPPSGVFRNCRWDRYETKFIQTVPIDPAIAELIGINFARQVSYSKRWIPQLTGRLSYTMKSGVAYLNGGRAVTPGNGLFLTSRTTTAGAGYTYTALKRWSANATVMYNTSKSLGNFIGTYGSYAASINVSRQVARYTHGMLSSERAQVR